MIKHFTLFACIFIALLSKAQVSIDPDDPNIKYWGRVDLSNPKAPAFEWAGVTIRVKFTGSSISAKLEDFAQHGATTTNYFYKIVDGGNPVKFEALAGNHTYVLATGLSKGAHTLEIVKLTEANVGRSALRGFILDPDGSLQPVSDEPSCLIEFIGNSITSGYGNEVSIPAPPTGNPSTGFTSVNENNYRAWGYVAARQLAMRYTAVSYSGRGLYRNYDGATAGTLPLIYDRIFPDDVSSPTWDHTAQHPNYIVINLGTNDFALDPAQPVSQSTFEATYINFVKKLKGYHPDATLILAVGVMMSDGYPSGAQHWTKIRMYVKNVVNALHTTGFNDVHYFEMSPQSPPYGEDWHPSAATHSSMGASLATFIKGLGVSTSCAPVVGINDPSLKESLWTLHPNPAKEQLFIDTPSDGLDWTLYNNFGQILEQGTSKRIDLANLPPSIYFVKINDKISKFIKL